MMEDLTRPCLSPVIREGEDRMVAQDAMRIPCRRHPAVRALNPAITPRNSANPRSRPISG